MHAKYLFSFDRKTLHGILLLGIILSSLGAGNLPSARALSGAEPNLAPAAPGGWSGPLVLSSVTGTNLSDTLYASQDTYVTGFEGIVLNVSHFVVVDIGPNAIAVAHDLECVPLALVVDS